MLVYLTNTSPAGIKLDPTLVVVALIPFIVWLVISGRVKEFKGPGGLDVILRDTANDKIPTELGPLPIEPAITIDKASEAALEMIEREHPTSLSFQLGKHNYSNQIISRYLDALESNPKFNMIIFTDEAKRLKGMMKARDFHTLHERDQATSIKIASGEILQAPGVITNSIQQNSTNKEALEQMNKTGTDVLPVVDAQGKYVGYVRRDRILGDVIAKLLAKQ